MKRKHIKHFNGFDVVFNEPLHKKMQVIFFGMEKGDPQQF